MASPLARAVGGIGYAGLRFEIWTWPVRYVGERGLRRSGSEGMSVGQCGGIGYAGRGAQARGDGGVGWRKLALARSAGRCRVRSSEVVRTLWGT
jgi:hypothetical protein